MHLKQFWAFWSFVHSNNGRSISVHVKWHSGLSLMIWWTPTFMWHERYHLSSCLPCLNINREKGDVTKENWIERDEERSENGNREESPWVWNIRVEISPVCHARSYISAVIGEGVIDSGNLLSNIKDVIWPARTAKKNLASVRPYLSLCIVLSPIRTFPSVSFSLLRAHFCLSQASN